MNFRITGLAPGPFLSVFGLPDDELAARGTSPLATTALSVQRSAFSQRCVDTYAR